MNEEPQPVYFSDQNGEPVPWEGMRAGYQYTVKTRDDDWIFMSYDHAERVREMTSPHYPPPFLEPNRHERRRARKLARSGR